MRDSKGRYTKGHQVKHSEETKKKISDARKGMVFSREHRRKIAEAGRGRRHTEEAKRKMREAHKDGHPLAGRKKTPEHRQKISKTISKLHLKNGGPLVQKRGISGEFYSKKNKQTLHYRSLLELSWYRVLEQLSKVHRYYVEPVLIEYEWEGSVRYYIPDLRVRYTDGTTELIEIKPEDEWNLPKNLAKWKAARAWCQGRRKPTTFRVVGYGGVKEKRIWAGKAGNRGA